MPDKPSELKPCPFCGYTEIEGLEIHQPNEESPWCVPWVMCGGCNADAALSDWNRRTPDRAALVEVARRAIDAHRSGMSKFSAVDRVVTEYLVEQAGKEGE